MRLQISQIFTVVKTTFRIGLSPDIRWVNGTQKSLQFKVKILIFQEITQNRSSRSHLLEKHIFMERINKSEFDIISIKTFLPLLVPVYATERSDVADLLAYPSNAEVRHQLLNIPTLHDQLHHLNQVYRNP